MNRQRVEGTWTDTLYRIELDIYYLEEGGEGEEKGERQRMEQERGNAHAKREQ